MNGIFGAPNRTRTCDTSDCGTQNARMLTLRILTAAQKPPPCFRHRRRSVSFQLTVQLTLTETCSLTRSTLFMAKQKQPLTRLLLFCLCYSKKKRAKTKEFLYFLVNCLIGMTTQIILKIKYVKSNAKNKIISSLKISDTYL